MEPKQSICKGELALEMSIEEIKTDDTLIMILFNLLKGLDLNYPMLKFGNNLSSSN